MKRLATIAWTLTLLSGSTSTFAADDTQQLPERFAAVVLNVEGMT